MLIRLEIRDFAVISRASFEPGFGLNVITGETGAGKSLLVDALGLIMGDKANRNVIRSGSDSAFVEAVFDISGISSPELTAFLEESDIDHEEEMLIISRKINTDGKSIARINGKTVVLSVLRKLASFLIDIHGQNDTQVIFDESKNCELLYSFGGEEVRNAKADYDKALAEYKDVVLQIRNLSGSPEQLKKRREYLEFAISEIEEAGLYEGMEEDLMSRKKRLARGEKLSEALTGAYSLIDDDKGAYNLVSSASSYLNRMTEADDGLDPLKERLSSVLLELSDIRDELSGKIEELDYDGSVKEDVDRRISKLFDLKSKYGDSVAEIMAFAEHGKAEIDAYENNRDILSDLRKKSHVLEQELLDRSSELTKALRKAADVLGNDIVSELADLEMPDCLFEVQFKERSKEKYFSAHGVYDIRFMFSANKGQEAKPLSSIVSGGEASRIMLAIKNILSRFDSIPTMIFDEIDMGVSGKASVAIAYKLHSIAKGHQVLCVSHTSQICAAADNNYLITKNRADDTISSDVTKLDKEGKINEVSRLLSGKTDEESVNLAKNLIKQFSV